MRGIEKVLRGVEVGAEIKLSTSLTLICCLAGFIPFTQDHWQLLLRITWEPVLQQDQVVYKEFLCT
jgi:hypothetical protein